MTLPDPQDRHRDRPQDRSQDDAHDSPSGDPQDDDARHRRALVLSEVAAEGPAGLSRVLRRAASDEDAAAVPVSTLVHAVPGMTAPDGHDLLARAQIRDGDLAGDLSPGQRVALVELVTRTDPLAPPPPAGSGGRPAREVLRRRSDQT